MSASASAPDIARCALARAAKVWRCRVLASREPRVIRCGNMQIRPSLMLRLGTRALIACALAGCLESDDPAGPAQLDTGVNAVGADAGGDAATPGIAPDAASDTDAGA